MSEFDHAEFDHTQWAEENVRTYLHDRYGLDSAQLRTEWLAPLLAALARAGATRKEVESAIVSTATVHESMFLRHGEQFVWLRDQWWPELMARRGPAPGNRTVRVLSAACACGEEPYSLAAVLLPLLPDGWRLEVEAVDASEASLVAAARGNYSRWALRGVPAEAINDWLAVDGNLVTVADHVRGPVRFRRHNLLDPLPSEWSFDLILCRNVMIYFHPDAIRQTFQHLTAALRPGGALLLGPSDPRPPEESRLGRQWHGQVVWYGRQRNTLQLDSPTHIAAEPAATLARPAQSPARPAQFSARPAPIPARPAGLRAATRSAGVRPRESGVCEPTAPAPEPVAETPQACDAQYLLAQQLVLQGDQVLALRVLRQLLCYSPLHVPALVLASMVAAELGDRDLAVVSARKAAYLEPDSPYPVFILADALWRQGCLVQAETRYQWARRLLDDWNNDNPLPFSEQLTARQLKELLNARSAPRVASPG